MYPTGRCPNAPERASSPLNFFIFINFFNKHSPVAPIIPKLAMSPGAPPYSQKPDTCRDKCLRNC